MVEGTSVDGPELVQQFGGSLLLSLYIHSLTHFLSLCPIQFLISLPHSSTIFHFFYPLSSEGSYESVYVCVCVCVCVHW